MTEKKKYYLTTPLYYVNAAPHLGHAYSTLVADTIRRFKRMQGYDAFLLTGNDEHGQNIERIARDRGVPPKEHCDELSAQFRSLWERLGIQYDEFIRTTEERHKLAVLELWSRLTKAYTPDGQPAIYRGKYSGWYCPRCEEFKDEAGMREPDHQCVGIRARSEADPCPPGQTARTTAITQRTRSRERNHQSRTQPPFPLGFIAKLDLRQTCF